MNKYTILAIISFLSFSFQVQAWNEALYHQIEQSIEVPRLGTKEYVITHFGAAPDKSAAQNQRAIQQTIDECSRQGGGRVVVPAGRYTTGALTLKSGVNLVVEEGAWLEFAFEPSLYPIVETSWEGLGCFNLQPCIYAFEAHDIAITGRGTIDGGGSNTTWWAWCGNPKFGWQTGLPSQRLGGRDRLLKAGEDGVPMHDAQGERSASRVFTAKDGMRPQLVHFNRCRRILIEDVTLLRSPFWVVHPFMSSDVTLRRVHIINDGPNGDGCDPESCDRVLIEDCYFSTGDDCIAIKSGRNRDGRERGMPSQNIIIRRCQMKNGHGGVVIGSEISGGCHNVFAHDCVMDSPNLDRVLRIKTNSCRGGVVENIHVKDIEVGQCREAVVKINLNYEPRERCCRGFLPTVKNVDVENVRCQQSRYGVMIIGLDTATCVSDIHVRDCHFDGVAEGNSIQGKTHNVSFQNLFINGSLVLQTLPYEGRYSEWMVRSEMQRTPKSYLLDFSKSPKWSYVMGIELEAMLDTYLHYGGNDILRYCHEYVDTMIDEKGRIRNYELREYNLDNVRTGHFLARMYQLQPEDKVGAALRTLMRQLRNQPRTANEKIYWHKAIYAYQVWLDGIFMGLPFRCLAAPLTTKSSSTRSLSSIYDDAVNQLLSTYHLTLDAETGLNRHAYDENRNMFWANPQTGLSQHCWGRAQGWFTMAIVELLDALPVHYARRGELIELLRKDLDAVLRWQDPQTGLWYQVMDAPRRQGNYLESSCSSMFAYALLKAANRGWVDDEYRKAGLKAYEGIIRQFVKVHDDQSISLTGGCSVAGLGPGHSSQVVAALKKLNPGAKLKENKRRDGSFDYYLSEPIRDNDPKAVAPFVWASLEKEYMERLFPKDNHEIGTLHGLRKPEKRETDFDVVVHPGDTIQHAIEQAAGAPEKPFKILIRNGVYRQKVIIDRPNIVLVGEDRDSTILILAEAREKLTPIQYHGRTVGNGVIVMQEGADDCIISGLTVYNNYGTAVDPGNTTHQMAIYGRGTRTIVINCNIWADGNDALSLWPPGGGLSYHADLFLRCPGVDFLCPRGWCYATRCHFLGDSRAIIWHDGSGDKDKKLVIKDSYFDAKSPTILGRYHRDAQFVLLNCKLSSQILDRNIRYAYADKQPDPNPWGLRAYYYNCVREGGDSGWLQNNLDQMEGSPQPHQITARWTFQNQWDPEARIRELWHVLAY